MQLLLSLPKTETKKTLNQKLTMRRAIAKWLWENKRPAALAMDVSTRYASLKVDMAALWTGTRKTPHVRGGILEPQRSAVIICCLTREDCWPECSNTEDILQEITALKDELARQEAEIRSKEPHLRDGNVLFDELASWNYAKSSSKAYHQNRHRLSNLESALFKGTRLARIDESQCANFHYLAVPEGALAPHELLENWGLFSVNLDTETATLLSEPVCQETSADMQAHLSLNMLIASTRQVDDMLGLKLNDDSSVSLVRPPSVHHKTIN